MKIEVHDDLKYVSVWLTKAESRDEGIFDKLTPLCEYWRERKYKFVVFESGQKDLAEQTKALLKHSLEVSAREDCER